MNIASFVLVRCIELMQRCLSIHRPLNIVIIILMPPVEGAAANMDRNTDHSPHACHKHCIYYI